MIIDDDKSARTLLNSLVTRNQLGTVIAQLEEGTNAVEDILFYDPDILLIDLLLPGKDGIEIVTEVMENGYQGKVVMISCVEDADLISEAYKSGIVFYMNKPINQIETVSVLQNVIKMLELERSMIQIKSVILQLDETPSVVETKDIEQQLDEIFMEIGMVGLSGTEEIREVLKMIYRIQKQEHRKNYHLKDVYMEVSKKLYGEKELKVKQKSMEQRIRRTIQKVLSNLAELGCEDYYDPIFTCYANSLFDFREIRQAMQHIKDPQAYAGKINTKKFMEGILSRVD
ncbi:MAG: response regulator [Lachnospiraceae bacterium]|nr:response regulator [Lachnospiraceae bacterium]